MPLALIAELLLFSWTARRAVARRQQFPGFISTWGKRKHT